jgi:hypothetical protein
MTWQDTIRRLEQRGFDRYILGPFMIWYGMKSKGMNKQARRLLVTAGIFQVFYAWNSYSKLQEKIVASLKKEGPKNGGTITT